ncbi:MAG: formyl transferase [Deltaproteobacteria bacterium]|nr:formyl transferase [Deltaproteobacteria bacterium]
MPVTPIFNPQEKQRSMRVAAFMSGSGTNIIKLLEKQKRLIKEKGQSPFEVIFVFSDRSDGKCQGEKIAYENGLPYFSYDIRVFHHKKGLKRTALTQEGLSARKAFDIVAQRLINAFDIDVVALGGYMSYTTIDRCVNVHPADLSILDQVGKRVYVGDHAVLDAIIAGEKTLRSSTLWTDKGVDTGPLLMVSDPLKVELPRILEELRKDKEALIRIADEHQEKLKKIGDWKIFPQTITMIAEGRFALDENQQVYVDGKPVINGFRE